MTSDTLEPADRAHAEEARKPRRGHRAAIVTGAGFLALALVVAFVIAIWDWNWFRGPLARAATARIHREVTITGNLDVHLLTWTPSLTVGGVHIANPAWAGTGKMADIGGINVRIRLIPLLTGRVDLRRVEFDQPDVRLWRNRQGLATWDFSNGRNSNQPLRLPPIRNFIIRDGRLRVQDDVRRLTFTGTVNAHERLGRTGHGFEMTGQGALNAQPFHLEVTGGPLLNIDRHRPYPFDAEIRAGPTYVTAKGAIPRPFDFGAFYMDATARGPDLADLYGITGVPLPNTPPYDLHGRLSRNEHLYRIDGLGGRVGASDLSGQISVDAGRKPSFLKADLVSRDLSFPDLGALFGGRPKGAAAAPAAKVAAAGARRLLPDATLDVDRIRRIDADVTYKALSIRNAPVNLSAGSTRVRLDAGLLRAEPLTLDLPQGRITGFIQLDARKATPATNLDLRLTGARLEGLIPFKFQGATPFAGGVVGRARLSGTGDSVHKAFADADGQVTFVAPGGEIRRSIAELMGVDVIKGLGLYNSKSQQTTPIRCAVVNFQARNGVLNANQMVFDTGPVLVTGGGTINLGAEQMNLHAQGHPKKLQLVHLSVPVDFTGSLMHPQIKVQKGPAIAQAGVAVALGAALSPLAAILPFVDAGLAKNADCAALVQNAAQKGAPVKTARR